MRFLVVKETSGYSKIENCFIFSKHISDGRTLSQGTVIILPDPPEKWLNHWVTGMAESGEKITVPSANLVPLDFERILYSSKNQDQMLDKCLAYFPEICNFYSSSIDLPHIPQHVGNIFSRLTYSWLTQVFFLIFSRDLCDADVRSIGPQFTVKNLRHRFFRIFPVRLNLENITEESMYFLRLGSTLRKMFCGDITFAVITSILHSITCYLSVILIDQILQKAAVEEYLSAHIAAAMMVFSIFVESTLYNMMYERLNNIGVCIRTLLSYFVFVKMLNLHHSHQHTFSVGQQFNILSGDLVQFPEILKYSYSIWLAPIDVIFYLSYLYSKVGLPAIYGFSVIIFFIPLNLFIGSKIKKFQGKLMISKDKRLRAIQETLSGMKILKLYGWIASVLCEIEVLRDKEMKRLKAVRMLEALIGMIMKTCPIMICAVVFATYLASGNTMTPDVAFVIILVFNNIFFPIARFPVLVNGLIKLNVSLNRVNEFLNLPQVQHSPCNEDDTVLVINNLKLSLHECDYILFEGVNLQVNSGECVGICGPVSSGKSSLLLAIASKQNVIDGTVKVTESISYVPQQSWIMNGTVRENILFGMEFDEKRYSQVTSICCLSTDFDSLIAKDLTIVGNKGMNLSGGQKQRINIARALYARSKLILMDDPLCAVDATVGWTIFQNLISPQNSIMINRSILMVTHNEKYLRCMSRVYELKDGLVTVLRENFDALNTEVESLVSPPSLVTPSITQPLSDSCYSFNNEDSQTSESKIDLSTYINYLKLLRWEWFFFISFFMILAGSCNLSGRFLVAKFTSNDSHFNLTNQRFLIFYGGLSTFQSLFILISAFLMAHATYISSKRLHRRLTSSIFRSPMLFFERNTCGYIMNFFSRDINVNDENIPINVSNIMDYFFNLFFYLIGIPIIVPFIAIFILPLVFVYALVHYVYVKSIKQVQYLECASRNPLYANFMECSEGVATIRAFKNVDYVKNKFIMFLERNVRFEYFIMSMSRWLALRIEVTSSIVIYVATAVSLHLCSKDQMSVGVLGFVVTFSLASVVYMNWLIRFGGELESQIISFQRVHRNCHLPPEEPQELKLTYREIEKSFVKEGRIIFKDFCTKYRPEQELTLKNLNIEIRAGEKVAIVGRTGAGKSSLIMSLFRILPPVSGSIHIDDVDINKIPIHVLRDNLTIIPQDLFIFNGSFRKNIDPFGEHVDEKIWNTLKLVGLSDIVSGYPAGLESIIKSENLSAGEQQMLSLARAILRRTKIVILDEATANMDNETEEKIKNIVMQQFHQSTIITIAHRLLSILDYDRILVLQNGELIEADSPENLMKDPMSVFSQMLRNFK